MNRFIVINGRILDLEKYQEDFMYITDIASADMNDYLCTLGFKLVNACTFGKKGFSRQLRYYNSLLDMDINIFIRKREKFSFV